MNALDVVLVVAGLSCAWSGYRQGLIVGLLSFSGFVVGAVLGLAAAPRLLAGWERGAGQTLAAVGVVLVLAVLGQLLAGVAARSLRGRLRRPALRLLDSGLGALISVVALVVVVEVLATALRAAPVPVVARAIEGSVVLDRVDGVVPEQARGLSRSLRDLVQAGGFPRVFAGLTPERIRPVDPPSQEVAASPVAEHARASAVQVSGPADACGRLVEGSGVVYARERVLTNAHVVAGVDEPRVRVGGRGRRHDATVVAFDPARDIAVLAVPGLDAPALALDDDVTRGDEGLVVGFPGGGPYSAVPARVRERLEARGQDIFGRDRVTREVLSLYTRVHPGNSGGPLVSPAGTITGLVFAKSLDDPDTGYALTPAEVAPVARAGVRAARAVDTGECVGG